MTIPEERKEQARQQFEELLERMDDDWMCLPRQGGEG